MRSSILARIPGFRQRIIPEPSFPSQGSQARGTRLVVLMLQIQRKAFHFILYLLLESRCTKRKGDGLTNLTSCTLNEQYAIQCSAYFAKKEFTGKTTVSYRRNWFRCNSKIYKYCRRQTFVCESQENGICIIDTLISFIMHLFEYGVIFIPNSLL